MSLTRDLPVNGPRAQKQLCFGHIMPRLHIIKWRNNCERNLRAGGGYYTDRGREEIKERPFGGGGGANK